MAGDRAQFEQGTLWQRILRQTAHGLKCGALQPIPTKPAFIEEAGVRFLVRVVANLERKSAERRRDPLSLPGGPDFNPFSPYDQDLYVAHVNPSHVCLLNKYNVVEHHLLIVTESFEDQRSLLTREDFEALCTCMREFSSLGFYNGGIVAGASQRHKHLQLVPLPLATSGPTIPIAPLVGELPNDDNVGSSAALPFAHALAGTPASQLPLRAAAATMHARYLSLLGALKLTSPETPTPAAASQPYNLLVGPRWMLLAPRSRECLGRVSVNSLGFAGALLVRNDDELAELQSVGPLAVLKHVGIDAEPAQPSRRHST